MSKIRSAEEIYLHGSTNRHLPQVHTLAFDFKMQHLLSILTSPAFHPNVYVQLVTFSPCTLAGQPPHLISQSLCLYGRSSSSLSGGNGQRSHKKASCASPLTMLQTKQWERAITKSFWHHPCSLSPEHTMPSLSSTGTVEAPTHHREFHC